MIYLAADHRGFELKEKLTAYLADQKYEMEDLGDLVYNKDDDYVDFARAACEKISQNPEQHRGIFICGSGHGMDMVANHYRDIRAALGFNEQVTIQSREHENSNVLVLAADWLDGDSAKKITKAWLDTKFTGEERNMRRLNKIKEIENKNFK